jgi:hypothetical protein
VYIKRFRVHNYKSFIDSGDLDLGPGFNVICGQNNAGKTALLEALDPATAANPHRSLSTVPTPQSMPNPNSCIEASFQLTHAELLEILRERGPQVYTLPWPAGETQDNLQIPALFGRFLNNSEFVFQLRRDLGAGWSASAFPTFGRYSAAPGAFAQFKYNIDGTVTESRSANGRHDIGVDLSSSFQDRIYRFGAERLNLSFFPAGTNPRLVTNAANLAQVLSILQANTPKFAYFNRLVHEVLSQVHQVSVVPIDSSQVEIRVWTLDPSSQRLDLAMPLAQCGTGIGQVLAILYVAVFSTSSQVLIIDEPQSFLHPGAIRKLVQVLKTYSDHQFIVATHSPSLISAAEPETIAICRIKEGVSSLTRIDPGDSKDLQSYLIEVGARLSDVFGADNILWVEGRTEEICFPRILERIGKRRLRGTTLLAVSNTGDFQTDDAKRVFDMYNRLSERNSLLPPAVGFIFDTESRSSAEKAELTRRSRDLLKFLPRRMYENYLLDPRAIAAVVNQIEGFRNSSVTDVEIVTLIQEMKRKALHVCPPTADLVSAPWKVSTSGGKVLAAIFNQLSDSRVAFDKVKHAVLLTDWLIEHAPDELKEVSELIVSCLPRAD